MSTRAIFTLSVLLLLTHCDSPPFPANDGANEEDICLSDDWTCNDISGCADSCGSNMECINLCKEDSCPGAVETFDTLTQCAAANCALKCMGGSTPECDDCVMSSCATETAACLDHVCPAVDCGDPAPDESPDDPDTCEAWSCFDVSTCSEPCGSNLSCIDDCKEYACASAVDAFDAMTNCAALHCAFKCMGGSSTECDQCVVESCGDETESCMNHACRPEECTGAGPDPEPGNNSCLVVHNCVQECIFSIDTDCIDDCRASACPDSAAALDGLLQCTERQCAFECLLFSPLCTGCQLNKCAAELSYCEGLEC